MSDNIDYTSYFETLHEDLSQLSDLHDDLNVLENDFQSFTAKYDTDVKSYIEYQQTEIDCLNSQISQQNSIIQGLGFLVGEFLILLVGIVLYKLIGAIERA